LLQGQARLGRRLRGAVARGQLPAQVAAKHLGLVGVGRAVFGEQALSQRLSRAGKQRRNRPLTRE
jgi:hypothetical protein